MAPMTLLAAIALMIHSAAGRSDIFLASNQLAAIDSERPAFESGHLHGRDDRMVGELPKAPAHFENAQEAVDVRSAGFAAASGKVASLKDLPAAGVGMGLLPEPEMKLENTPMPAWPKFDKLRTQFSAVVKRGLGFLHGAGDQVVGKLAAAQAPIEKAARSDDIHSKEIDLRKAADREAVDMRSSVASLQESLAFGDGMELASSSELRLETQDMPRMSKPMPVVMPAMLPAMLGVVVMSAMVLVALILRMACAGTTKEDSTWSLGYQISIEWA